MDFVVLRTEFPVLDQVAYLNAGTCGPLPATALRAATEVGARAAAHGRSTEYFEAHEACRERVRSAYAALLGARPPDVAITTCTSEGVVRVLSGLDLRAGDEVVTATGEHPGLLGPLAAARRRRGISIRTASPGDLADAVGPRTRLVACSHVRWATGETAPAVLGELGSQVPVLLDGAQGLGAVPVDVQALGCAFYAGSGQKWLCGPVGTGMLWISPAWRDRLGPLGPTLHNLSEPELGLDALPHRDARAHDAFALPYEGLAAALAAHDTLAAAGWDAIHARGRGLASRLAAELEQRGRVVAARGETTLVSWEDDDPDGRVAALASAGVVVRRLPRTPYVRASVGAWNDETDLARLLAKIA